MFAALSDEATPARAAPREAAPEDAFAGSPSARADAYFRQGKELVRRGKLEEAYEAYRAGYALKQGYDLAGNLGNVELALGKARDAAEHLAFCLRNFPATASPQQLAFIQQRFAEARREVSALAVTVDAAGAEILVDGRPVGRAPLPDEVYVTPGLHLVEARLAGHEPAQARVTFEKGGVQALSFSLAREAKPPAAPPPEASGAPASAPPAAAPLPPWAFAPAGVGQGSSPGASSAAPASSPASAPRALPRASRGVIIAGLSTAVVGLGVGVAGLVASNASAASASSQRAALERRAGTSACTLSANTPACDELDHAYLDRESLRVVSITGFTVAGGAALATLIYTLAAGAHGAPALSPARAEPRAASPWVSFAPGRADLGLRGRF